MGKYEGINIDKKYMTEERYKKMMKTYNLVSKLVNKYGTEDAAKTLTEKGFVVTASELKDFKKE